jgi:hypothetical protein
VDELLQLPEDTLLRAHGSTALYSSFRPLIALP